MVSSTILAVMATLATPSAALLKGFNYGSTFTTGAPRMQSDWENIFGVGKNLPGVSGFTNARLYTMVQAGTANDPIQAIPAAINTGTGLLLGLWASGGDAGFANEITALKNAINKYGKQFADRVVGISVGSEDLYRISPTGIAAKSGAGADPQVVAGYIGQLRQAIAGTVLSGASIGHVDTWTAYVNGSNQAVINAVDWVGVDAYPYFQNTMANSIDNSPGLFFDAYQATVGAAGGKPVWITETGFPVSGPTENQAVPNTQNAKQYWDDVYCEAVRRNINVFWYTLRDADPQTPSPSFGLIPSDSTTPLFDLTCPAQSATTSSAAGSSSSAVSTGESSVPSSAQQESASASGASVIASLDSGVTSSAGSGPIVTSADSFVTSASASATGSGSSASASPSSGASSGASSGSSQGEGSPGDSQLASSSAAQPTGSSSSSGSGSSSGSSSGTGSGSGSGSGASSPSSGSTTAPASGSTPTTVASAATFGASVSFAVAIGALLAAVSTF